MLLSLIQLLAGVGVVLMLVAWISGEDVFAIVAGLLGLVAWGLVAYGLFNIETIDAAGTSSEPALALFAVAAAVVTVLPALVNPFEMVGESSETSDPMERI